MLRRNLDHTKQRPPRTLQKEYAQGPLVVLGGGAVSCERGTSEEIATHTAEFARFVCSDVPSFVTKFSAQQALKLIA